MDSNLDFIEIKLDNYIRNIIDKLYYMFQNKIYLRISLPFLIVSSIIFLITKNIYWFIFSFPFTLPWFCLGFIMFSYLLIGLPYTLTFSHLIEHKINIYTARLIAFLVQIAVLSIILLFSIFTTA